jgi:cytochrome c biogenesis protein CcmG/thiol:disulfide interchange protein DsbE
LKSLLAYSRLLVTLLMVAVVATAVTAPAAAQGVRLHGLKGEQLAEADLSQGTSIVVVWASWSPHSRDIVERVNPIAQRWGGRARVVTVNFQEEAPAVQGFLSGKSLAVPVFLDSDGAFSKKYAVAILPGLLVVKDGQVVYRGKLPDDPDRVIVELLH